MGENLVIGLKLTLFGTGLVFLVLAFLWGLMWLLLALDVEEPEEKVAQPAVTEEASAIPSPLEQALIALALLRHRGAAAREIPEETQAALPGLQHTWTVLGRLRQLQSWHPRRGEE